MEHLFGQDWEIVPAGGATGAAYFAQHEEQRLFLKRNSSPFLAVLSAEGIVPKLVWTKRLENGDVITAQQWMNGRELKPGDMNNERVAKLLKKIHASEPLLGMLTRLGKSPLKPEMFLHALNEELDEELRTKQAVIDSLKFLTANVVHIDVDEKVVCHCDVNHNNWLLTEDNQLYLIDWDGAMIADPAIDLGLLLYSYIPVEEWEDWLEKYGIILTENLQQRMKWYALAQSLSAIQWHKNQNRIPEMEKWIDFLKALI
ncbi:MULTISPECIES: phosphotransferase family protein [Mesobacillus]|uniref:phosphotransferase family protein n=1 Tax=Mesobacillus TaxID=2675231 RepID=UPI001781C10B|nr:MULTISPECIES: phosphotransferase family protein [Mesobacillus]MCM3572249.1 phosphotransferase family protein [Mesobacillus subterraneus]UYZ21107.1 phosphotransferase family protein [Mesobacillus jeotgali]